QSQLILAPADDAGTDSGGDAIELGNKHSLLREGDYADIRNDLIPLNEMVLRSGLGDDGAGG
ncbi:MAG: hypothetical protein F6K03_12385, partial [Kamptonema sp. SIO4C4]|nr:hypothetical protein [Kamptonema sp. SIO4C4]